MNKKRNKMKEACDNVHNYYVDFIPQGNHLNNYDKVKDFICTNYMEKYENRLIAILLKLMIYFELRMYLTEFPMNSKLKESKEYAKFIGTDLYSLSIEEWVPIIKFVIQENISSVQILSRSPRFLISVNGNFINEFRRIPDSHVQLIKSIVESEGLFLIRMDE